MRRRLLIIIALFVCLPAIGQGCEQAAPEVRPELQSPPDQAANAEAPHDNLPAGDQTAPERGRESLGEKTPVPFSALCIATYNINFGNRQLDLVGDAIIESNADIVLLQETTEHSESYLRTHFAETHPHIAFFGHEGRYYAERFGILSRVPLQSMAFHEPVHGLFGFVTARTVVGDEVVQIINVHLDPLRTQDVDSLPSLLAQYSAIEQTHAREIEAVLGQAVDDLPTIIAGDFNGVAGSVAPRTLRQRGFRDSFATVNERPDDCATWRWDVGGHEVAMRIDFIFHDEAFRTLASRIVANESSDHCLLVSELALPRIP